MKVARVRRGPQPRLTSPFGVGGTAPMPALDDLSDVDTTGVTGGDTIVFDSGSSTWIPGTGSGSTLPWFIVTDFGAVGDGTTDDTAAIDSAIAALNSAGRGVLYFPAGTYKTTAALTTLSAQCLVMGDGAAALDNTDPISMVTSTSTTASVFTITADRAVFRDLAIDNTSGAVTNGAAITVTGSGYLATHVDYEGLHVSRFYVGIDVQVGNDWVLDRSVIRGCKKYGLKIRNTVNGDAGDWSISDSAFYGSVYDSDAAIRIESSGGGKIVNCKFNAVGSIDSHEITAGIDVAISSSTDSTTVLTVVGSSFENLAGDAIKIATTSTGTFGMVAITSCQFGLYSNNTGRIVNLNASSAGAVSKVILDGLVCYTNGTARAAVSLTNTDRVTLGDIQLSGNFTSRYTSSGDTNTTDGASISYATPAIVLGTAAAAGAASTVIRSDSTIVAFDTTVPTTAASADAAATGSAAVAARRDHRHGMPTLTPGIGEILISDTPSTPLVFADLLQNDAQDDLLYADP